MPDTTWRMHTFQCSGVYSCVYICPYVFQLFSFMIESRKLRVYRSWLTIMHVTVWFARKARKKRSWVTELALVCSDMYGHRHWNCHFFHFHYPFQWYVYTTGTIHEKWHWKGCWWFHQLPCTQEEANHLRLRLRRTRRLSGTNYCRLRCRSVYSMTHFIELDDGKIYRKPLYLMVKTMVSCRFSLKPIHWPIPFKELGVSKDFWIFMADQSLWFLASTLHGKNHAKSFLGICHILAQLRFEGVPPEQWELERWHEWADWAQNPSHHCSDVAGEGGVPLAALWQIQASLS